MNQFSFLPVLIRNMRPRAILSDVTAHWGMRSTVPGPGMAAVHRFLARRHQENGLAVDIHSYPADGGDLPFEWIPKSARLEIIEPVDHSGTICSFQDEPLSLLSNSQGTPTEGITAEVVLIPKATSAEAYQGYDASGKIVFTDVWPLQADEQAREHGAVGIITDSVTPPWLYQHPPVRTAWDTPDLTMWGVLSGMPHDQPLWGFSLSPRQGAQLRELIKHSSTPVRLRATVDAQLSAGLVELFSACISGKELPGEEVWILSHSSEPGALDNASGCCASIEIGRLLKSLIESGELSPPRRSIRFLSSLETYGYLPYLAERMHQDEATPNRERPGLAPVVAALAFDSIGADFRQTGSVLRMNRSPDYNPTFADELLEAILKAVSARPANEFAADPYELFPWQVDPCFPGNDNMLADGFYDTPTPMLDCWPDRFYHSNQDTPDKLTLGSLARCTVIAAAYVYSLACAGPKEAEQMAALTLQAWKRRFLESSEIPSNRWLFKGQDALFSLLRLEPSIRPQVERMAVELAEFFEKENHSPARQLLSPSDAMAISPQGNTPMPTPLDHCRLSPSRWQPPAANDFSEKGQEIFGRLVKQFPGIHSVWWLVNHRRTALEICERSDLPQEGVLEYLNLLLSESFLIANLFDGSH